MLEQTCGELMHPLVLAFHCTENGAIAKLSRATAVIPLAEATLPMGLVGDVTLIAGQAADDRARELLLPLLVIVERLGKFLQHSLKVLRIQHGKRSSCSGR
jgi:hypothetical protein